MDFNLTQLGQGSYGLIGRGRHSATDYKWRVLAELTENDLGSLERLLSAERVRLAESRAEADLRREKAEQIRETASVIESDGSVHDQAFPSCFYTEDYHLHVKDDAGRWSVQIREKTELMAKPEEDDRPHSRACGIVPHEHGSACHGNCPSCFGITSRTILQEEPPSKHTHRLIKDAPQA